MNKSKDFLLVKKEYFDIGDYYPVNINTNLNKNDENGLDEYTNVSSNS